MMSCCLGMALGAPVGGAAPAPPLTGNQLLWTEDLTNAVWVKAAITITADATANPNPPGDGSTTADLAAWSAASRNLQQATAISAISGGGSATFLPSWAIWTRQEVTAVIDGVDWVASVYVMDQAGMGNNLRLFLEVALGVIRVRLTSLVGPVGAYVWGWQLETGTTAGSYTPRTV